MFDNLKELLGEEAFNFIEKIVPELISFPIKSTFPRLLFQVLVYVFEHEDKPLLTLGNKILEDENKVPKLMVIENVLLGMLRGLDASNNNKEIVADKGL